MTGENCQVYDFCLAASSRMQAIARQYLDLKDAERAAVVAESLHVMLDTLHRFIGIDSPPEPMTVTIVRTQRETLLALDFEPESGDPS